MKKAYCYLVAIYALLNIPLFGNNLSETKLYLDSANVKVMPEGLFLELDNGLLPIDAIGKDAQGIFIIGYSKKTQILYCADCGMEFDLDKQSPYCPHPAIE